MKIEHQKLLLDIARDAILRKLDSSTANGSAFAKGSGATSCGWTRLESPSAEGCPEGGVGFQCLESAEGRPDLGSCPELKEKRATFVTLTLNGNLRGCIGMLEACRPLVEDVAENAVSAAFHDPRFPPLSREEFDDLKISISVLSPPQEMIFSDEADLLEKIRPGIDGLILQEGFRKGTFLPSVWEELPETERFFEHLKLKAGLPAGYWSDTLCVSRYTAETIQNRSG